VKAYQFRPEIELYDVAKDPLEMTNLADNPEYAEVKKELRRELEAWMTRCGDKGQATELEAFDHMPPGKKMAYERRKQKQ